MGSFSAGENWAVYFASDRYAYLPSVGILLAVAVGIAGLKRHRTAVATALIAVLCVLTHQQSKLWLSGEALFGYVANRAPQTHLAHHLLGILDLKRENYLQAITHFGTSAKLEPNFPDARAELGLAMLKTDNLSGGQAELTQAIAADPTYLPTYVYQAYGYLLQGKQKEADRVLQFVLQQEPNNKKALELMSSIK